MPCKFLHDLPTCPFLCLIPWNHAPPARWTPASGGPSLGSNPVSVFVLTGPLRQLFPLPSTSFLLISLCPGPSVTTQTSAATLKSLSFLEPTVLILLLFSIYLFVNFISLPSPTRQESNDLFHVYMYCFGKRLPRSCCSTNIFLWAKMSNEHK